MALRPYEVLFRFHGNGTVSGHIQNILDDAIPQNPEPFATSGPEFDAIMAQVNTALAGERDTLKQERDALQQQLNALLAELSAGA